MCRYSGLRARVPLKPKDMKPLPPKETIVTGKCPHCDTMLITITRRYLYAKDLVGVDGIRDPYEIMPNDLVKSEITKVRDDNNITYVCNICKTIIGFSEGAYYNVGISSSNRFGSKNDDYKSGGKMDDDMMMFGPPG